MRALLQSLHRRRSPTNTNSRARTLAPERIDPATPPYIYIYIFRLEMDKNLKNEIIALITRVITLQLTSHFFPFSN